MMLTTMLIGICLAACGSQALTPSRSVIVGGSLATPEAYLERGDQYFDLADYSHAIADYSQAIKLKPDYAEAYNNRGLAYALSGKQEMAQAVSDYSQAIRLRPDYAYAYNNRGVAYMASGHPDEALQDFDRAIQLQPDFPQAHSNRGNAYYRAGRLDWALLDLLVANKILAGVVVIVLGLLLMAAFLGVRIVRRRGLRHLRRMLTPD